jgi:hypothetical protein
MSIRTEVLAHPGRCQPRNTGAQDLPRPAIHRRVMAVDLANLVHAFEEQQRFVDLVLAQAGALLKP